jgi:hypothetical protein
MITGADLEPWKGDELLLRLVAISFCACILASLFSGAYSGCTIARMRVP